MPTLRIIYDVEGWAYHARAVALRQHAPADFDVTIAALPRRGALEAALGGTAPDLILALSQYDVPAIRQALVERAWSAKLISAWNSGWPLQIPIFYRTYALADAVIINNRTAWERVGGLPRTYMLPNGVDLDRFRVINPLQRRRPRVLWTGSQLGRGRKGYDRFIVPLQQALHECGIDCELLLVDSYGDDKRSAAEMAAWYNTGTVLVCASEAEGTPNPALEAAACGCTVVSTPVGNMPELIRSGQNGYLVERESAALLAATRAACRDFLPLATEMQRDVRAWDWRSRSAGFYAAFREVLAPPPPRLTAPRNLSEQVTVFVTTVGAPSYAACRAHLEVQDCTYALEIIDRVAPMNAAFQRMLDRCRTPFFVQVDEDMLLYPHAIRALCDQLAEAEASVAMCMGELYDAHLARCILGVKIYRHAIVRRYPFADVQSFEKLQMRQLKADGYTLAWAPPAIEPTRERTLGLHGTHWTAASIFERYATLERRRQGHPRDLAWFAEYPPVFLRRFLDDPCELNFFALMGALWGALAGPGADKDYRTYDALPGLQATRQLFERLCGARADAARAGGALASRPEPVDGGAAQSAAAVSLPARDTVPSRVDG